MKSYDVFQAIVIAFVLAWSLWFGLRRTFPRSYRSMQANIAQRFLDSSNTTLHKLGLRWMPKQVTSAGGCDSDGGCSTCGTCAPTATNVSDPHPLVFHPRHK